MLTPPQRMLMPPPILNLAGGGGYNDPVSGVGPQSGRGTGPGGKRTHARPRQRIGGCADSSAPRPPSRRSRLLEHRADLLDAHGERDPLQPRLQRDDADHPAVLVQQRSAGVARVDGGGVLEVDAAADLAPAG